MYAEIKLTEKSSVYEAYMKVAIDRRDAFMQKIMKQYSDGLFDESDPAFKDRVKILLRNSRLIDGSNILPDGHRIINEGKIQVTEEGQYNILSIKNGLSSDRIFLSISRNEKIRANNFNKNRRKVNATLYDRDQKMMVRVNGTIESYLESTGPTVTDRLELSDDGVNCSVIVPIEGVEDVPFETVIGPEKILAEVIKDYDVSRNAVVIKDLSTIGDEEISTLSMDVDANRNAGFNTRHLMNMEVTGLRVNGLSLCAPDIHVAEKWMDELRERNWGHDFVTVEQAKTDQEYWSEKLLGKVEGDLILGDEDLLDNLSGKEAFWGVAAMMDLIPEHGYRKPFYITSTSDIQTIMKKNIFTDSLMSDLRCVVLVDSYIRPDSHEVLRRFMGRTDVPILYIMNTERANSAKGDLLRKNSKEPEGVRIIWDNRDKKQAHSRYIILIENNGERHIWNPDNSINNFKMKGDKVVNIGEAEYRPKSKIQDEYVEGQLKAI